MFKCRYCNKTYTSEDRLSSHKKRCEANDTRSEVSYRSHRSDRSDRSHRSHRSSVYNNSISDIEKDSRNRRDTHKKDLDSIIRDREKLKRKLRNTVEEFEKYKIEKRREIDNIIQQTSIDISRIEKNTKNNMLEELEDNKSEINKDYRKKLDLYKQKCEKENKKLEDKYIDELTSIKNTLILKENEIDEIKKEHLQEINSIKSKISNREDISTEKLKQIEQDFQTKLIHNMNTYEAKLKTLETIIRDRDNEKNHIIKNNKKELEDIQKNLELRYSNKIIYLTNEMNDYKSALEKLKNEKDEIINTIKEDSQIELNNTIIQKDRQYTGMHRKMTEKLDKEKELYKIEVENLKKSIDQAVQDECKKHEQAFYNFKADCENKNKILRTSHKLELEKMFENNKSLQSEIDYQKRHSNDLVKMKEEEMISQFQKIIDKIENEKIIQKNRIEELEEKLKNTDEIMNINNKNIEDREKNLKESTNIFKLKIQEINIQHQKELDELKKNNNEIVEKLKNKYMSELKQINNTSEKSVIHTKTIYDKELKEKIKEVENENFLKIKTLNHNFKNKLQNKDNEIKSLQDQITEIENKNKSNYDTMVFDKNLEITTVKQKSIGTIEAIKGQITEKENEIKILKSTHNEELAAKDMQINNLKKLYTEIENKENVMVKLKNEYQNTIHLKDNEIHNLKLDIENEKLNFSQKLKLESEKISNSETQQKNSEKLLLNSKNKINELNNALEMKNRTLENLKNQKQIEINELKKNITEIKNENLEFLTQKNTEIEKLKDDMKKLKNNIEDEKINIRNEKQKLIAQKEELSKSNKKSNSNITALKRDFLKQLEVEKNKHTEQIIKLQAELKRKNDMIENLNTGIQSRNILESIDPSLLKNNRRSTVNDPAKNTPQVKSRMNKSMTHPINQATFANK